MHALTDTEKLTMIRNLCDHPGAFHWSGRDMAKAIRNVLDDNQPIDYRLSDVDEPIRYELIHDAVAEEVEDGL